MPGAVNFQFEVFGEPQVHFMFLDMKNRASNFGPAFEGIAKDYYEGETSTFAAEGAFEGKPSWAPLSAKYAERKRMRWGDKPILEASGALKAAATNRAGRGSIFRMSALSLAMGVDLRVGGWNLGMLHQLGTRKLPKREVIRITPNQEKRWVRSMRDFLFNAKTPLPGIA